MTQLPGPVNILSPFTVQRYVVDRNTRQSPLLTQEPRIKLLHDDTLSRDDLIAWACFRISRLQQGVRVVHFFDTEGKRTNGSLLVKINKRVVPGSQCLGG